jgi:cell division septum initiation protein DivIVA/DNA-binding transcriptional regulator YdaS (Cro superfamily)
MTSPLDDRRSGEDLRQARRAADLTQAALADRLGVRLWMIDAWESGARAIPADRIDEIAKATGWRPGEPTDGAVEAPAVAIPEEGRASRASRPVQGESQLPIPSPGSTMETVDDGADFDQNLPRALRGYDPAAVRALVGKVEATRNRLASELNEVRSRAADIEGQAKAAQDRVAQLEVRLQTAEDRAAKLEEQVQIAQARAEEPTDEAPDFRVQEDLIRDAILTAQKAANDVRDEARRSASEILDSARHEAERIVSEADKERERLAEEITRLEQLAETSRAAISGFLSSLLDADLGDVIFEHEIGKVAGPSVADAGEVSNGTSSS